MLVAPPVSVAPPVPTLPPVLLVVPPVLVMPPDAVMPPEAVVPPDAVVPPEAVEPPWLTVPPLLLPPWPGLPPDGLVEVPAESFVQATPTMASAPMHVSSRRPGVMCSSLVLESGMSWFLGCGSNLPEYGRSGRI